MALETDEIVALSAIVQETFGLVSERVVGLEPEQEEYIRERMDVWESIRDSHVKLTGEVDFDNERKRRAIRQELRIMLGLSAMSDDLFGVSSGLSMSVPTVPIW